MTGYEGGPGFLAFVVTFALVGATILLIRSLGKQLRKVRTHPPAADDAGEPGGAAATGAMSRPKNRKRGGDVVADESSDG